MEKVSTARIALKWGLIYGILSVLLTTILYNTSLRVNFIISLMLSISLTFFILFFALSEFKSLNNGFMKYSEGLGLGTLTLATGGILGVFYDFLYKKYIDSNIISLQLEKAQEQYESMGMSEDQIEKSIEKAQQYNDSGLSFLLAFLIVIFFGFICSIIMSAILKKDKPFFS